MSGQDSNVAQVDGSAARVSPLSDSSSNATHARGNDAVSSAIHNAILLGWSVMELKSRVQITGSNISLDSIIFDQQSSSFVATGLGPPTTNGPGNQPPPPTSGTGDQQPDVIDVLLSNVVLSDIEPLKSQWTANGSKWPSGGDFSLSSEVKDNVWLTSVMREIFRRIVALHLQRFPDSDTTNTIYDVNAPFSQEQPDTSGTDFPYHYLYPDKIDYATIGVSMLQPNRVGTDRVTPFVRSFRLYDVTRRALNCLTLLFTDPDDVLDPVVVDCFQKHLIPRVLGNSPITEAFPDDPAEGDPLVFVEPACEDLPPPSDADVKEAIKVLSSLVIRLLDAWDGFLRESFYVDIDSTGNEIELIAYEAGRSLAALTWGVSVALVPLENAIKLTSDQQKNPDIVAKLTKKVRDTWVGVFNERDINYLQQRISALSKALDSISVSTGQPATNGNAVSPGQAVQVVNASLDYWQRAVTQMCLPTPPAVSVPTPASLNAKSVKSGTFSMLRRKRTPPPVTVVHRVVKPALVPTVKPVHPQTGDAEPLLPIYWGSSAQAFRLTLIKQADIWRTLILGQRDLQSFNTQNVTQNILNDFMQDLEHATSNEFQRLRKRGRNVFWTVMIIGALVLGLVLAVLIFQKKIPIDTSQINNPLTLLVLLWGGVAAFVSSVMGRVGDVLSRFGPAGTAVADSFEKGYERVLLEFAYLNHNIAITYPLIEYFILGDFTIWVENASGDPIKTGIKNGYDFLAYVFWTDQDKKEEIKQVARAAFGPIGAFVGAELKFEQNPNGGGVPGGTLKGRVITNANQKTGV
jgi:hypothetical protein